MTVDVEPSSLLLLEDPGLLCLLGVGHALPTEGGWGWVTTMYCRAGNQALFCQSPAFMSEAFYSHILKHFLLRSAHFVYKLISIKIFWKKIKKNS